MLSAIRGGFLQHTRPGSFLPAFLLVLVLPVLSACGGGSSSSNDVATPASTNPISVTAGDGAVTVNNNNAGTARSAGQTACTYNVYIASQAGVTSENYSTLADGAMYENVTFPFTITGLSNDTTYYVAVYEVCGGVYTQIGDTVSATTLSPFAGDGVTPEPVDVTSVTAGEEAVTVSWSVPSDFLALTSSDYSNTNYTVCYGVNSVDNNSPCVNVLRGNSSHTVAGLTGGTQYCFGVKQNKTDIGSSAFGNTMCQTPTSAPVASGGGGDICDGDPLIAGLFTDSALQTCVDGKGWTNASEATGTLSCVSSGISNLTGLQCLTGLTTVTLYSNSIVDVSPLASLTNLTLLYLQTNSIVDVSPLASLTNLLQASLYENSIVDVSPLASLTSLTQLGLNSNSIVDVSDLASLTSLTYLSLSSNSIGGQGVGNVDNLAALTNITTTDSLNLSYNTGMSCTELAALIVALGSGPVLPDSASNGVNCTNP